MSLAKGSYDKDSEVNVGIQLAPSGDSAEGISSTRRGDNRSSMLNKICH